MSALSALTHPRRGSIACRSRSLFSIHRCMPAAARACSTPSTASVVLRRPPASEPAGELVSDHPRTGLSLLHEFHHQLVEASARCLKCHEPALELRVLRAGEVIQAHSWPAFRERGRRVGMRVLQAGSSAGHEADYTQEWRAASHRPRSESHTVLQPRAVFTWDDILPRETAR